MPKPEPRLATAFGLTSETYRAFRPPYPARLYARVLAALPDRPRALAVDLGAGTGLVTRVLGDHFERVLAVEPDDAMLAELRRVAPRATVWRGTAETARLPAGTVDLVTCANAFHWMNGAATAAVIADALRPGGVFAAWRNPMPTMPEPLAELVGRHMQTRWLESADPRAFRSGAAAEAIADAPRLERIALGSAGSIANPLTMDVDQLLGFMRSTSFVAAYLRTLGPEQAERYLAALAAELREIGESFTFDLTLDLTLARRTAGG